MQLQDTKTNKHTLKKIKEKKSKTLVFFDRMIGLENRLKVTNPEIFKEQKHCSSEYPSEQAYWHYGYLICMRDVFSNFELKEKRK